jgi:hypothetical protein
VSGRWATREARGGGLPRGVGGDECQDQWRSGRKKIRWVARSHYHTNSRAIETVIINIHVSQRSTKSEI